MATEQEPLLYLHITAQSKEALEKAVTIIQDLMQRDNKPPTREASSEGTPSSAPAGGDDRGGGRFGGENRFGGGGGENRFGGDNRFGGERREYRPVSFMSNGNCSLFSINSLFSSVNLGLKKKCQLELTIFLASTSVDTS